MLDDPRAQVFQMACNLFMANCRKAGKMLPDDPFLKVTDAIEKAWPDVVAMLEAEGYSKLATEEKRQAHVGADQRAVCPRDGCHRREPCEPRFICAY